MKLCIVTHRVMKGDGQGRVNYEVAKEALRRGHHITLLASRVAPELQENSQVIWVGISVEKLPTELLRNMVFARQSTDWLRQHRSEFDLLKVNGAITNIPGDVNVVHFVHSSWLRSPVNLSQQRRDLRNFYQWFYTTLNARWEKKPLSRAKVVVAVSKKVEQELQDIGIPQASIRVILNGVDLQEFAPGKADRQKWGLPEGVPLVLFAGNIQTSRKNLDTVLHALLQVPDLHLAVAGNIETSPYPQLAASLGLGARVHFLGHRHDVPEIMQAVDLFVFPSRYEACSLVLLEAMASGLPVITATTAGGAEIVTPECGVVLPDPDDAEALARTLATLTSDREHLQQMGQAARAKAEQHSWASMAQSYLDLFEEFSSS